MKLSLNWIKQYVDFELPAVDELVERIGAQLGAVEQVENLSEKYQGIVIAKVVSCTKHAGSDHLNVCLIDDGGTTPDVKRDENGLVQVVCGAPNVREGLLVAWLPPGSTVPESVGKDPFVLGARELRGVVSNGMLASAKELALGDNHDGILEINADEWSPNQSEVKPGADFGKVFNLDDQVIEIENKMFTHRPDLFGELGLAREVAGILSHKFNSPDWYLQGPDAAKSALAGLSSESELAFEVANEAPELVPRITAVVVKDVTIKPSPLWLQCELIRMGQKPVNNVVDATNYIMLLTAQPTHAYDYDKVRGHKLVARMAKPDEQITLLNHKTYKLDSSDIVISDGEGAVGLGGVMGGGDSEVSDATKNIVLECASFDMYTVRRSSMRHGVFTDAVTRFNKGQSPLQNANVLRLLVQSIFDVAGGEVASPMFDLNHAEGRQWVHPPVPVTSEFINARLGFNLKPEHIKTLLENVEFDVALDTDKLTVTAPFWRTDIESREDVVEEVGRLYGFDKLPLELPKRDIIPVTKDPMLELKAKVRASLAEAGANEVLTYSFVHGDLLDKVGQDKTLAFELSNALSPDLQYYRLSLTPSLLDKVHANSKAGYDDFALFELGSVHGTSETDEDSLPKQFGRVSLVWAAGSKTAAQAHPGAPFYQARKFAVNVLSDYITPKNLRFVPLNADDFAEHKLFQQMIAPFETNRSAVLYDGERLLGVVGEYRRSVAKALKLPVTCAGFELFLSAFLQGKENNYASLPRFPKVTQDITLKVPFELRYDDLYNFVWEELGKLQPAQTLPSLSPVDIYKREDGGAYKQISFRLSIASYEKTMTDSEVSKLLDEIAVAAKAKFGAERI